MPLPRAHDLIWITESDLLESDDDLPDWVTHGWRRQLPLVVRRDRRDDGAIPVGVRGMARIQRAAAWVQPANVTRVVTPESLVIDVNKLLCSSFISQQPVQALVTLVGSGLPWQWGVTGSCAYALASDIPVMHADSDLDLLIRCDLPVQATTFNVFNNLLQTLPCRVDVQINTPLGGFSLSEWLRGGDVLLKTDRGPKRVNNPWILPKA